MSNPIKELEDAMLVIGQELWKARDRAMARCSALDPSVFENAWKLGAGREANGKCPCCGRDILTGRGE